jgi:hypothetical protein
MQRNSNANPFQRRFSGDADPPFDLKLNDKTDPLAKLYDTAVLKIPKVIPSDSESLYSECNRCPFCESPFRPETFSDKFETINLNLWRILSSNFVDCGEQN